MMIEVLCPEAVEEVLTCPKEYIDDSKDIVLAKIHDPSDIENPIYIMIGMDEHGKCYLVIEDNDVSADYYPEDEETLLELYIKMLETTTKQIY